MTHAHADLATTFFRIFQETLTNVTATRRNACNSAFETSDGTNYP